jgi:hypothetical protein
LSHIYVFEIFRARKYNFLISDLAREKNGFINNEEQVIST